MAVGRLCVPHPHGKALATGSVLKWASGDRPGAARRRRWRKPLAPGSRAWATTRIRAAASAPCKTFAGAISKTADHGIINVPRSAGYGAVTITRSRSRSTARIPRRRPRLGTNGDQRERRRTSTVILRNLTIEGDQTPGLIGVNVHRTARGKQQLPHLRAPRRQRQGAFEYKGKPARNATHPRRDGDRCLISGQRPV